MYRPGGIVLDMWGTSYLTDHKMRRRPVVPVCGSLLLHALLMGWLLHKPAPRFVSPSSVAAGEGGSSLTFLFHSDPTGAPAASARNHAPVLWKARTKPSRRHPPEPAMALPDALTEPAPATASASAAPPAGSRFGTLGSGLYSGHEVRPALRVSGSEPVIGLEELAGAEGNVIIEITIDERGNIVAKAVIQSLSASVDGKVLAALEDWHFLPATEDGVAIPSKEDVYYHFPVRR